MLRYTAIASGAGTDNTLTRTQLLADAAAGPLKNKLANTPDSEWGGLDSDPEVSVYVSPIAGTPAVVGYNFGSPSEGVYALQLTALAAGTATVEIRFNHSIDR